MIRDYTVKLEQTFQGPMDLLLHLVREQEVDIHDIDLHRVIDGYLAHLKALREIDIELAADFLVMAATLMAIKSRSLLPTEHVDLAEELDPRDELIQRLIEYRRFKQASKELQDRFDARAKIHPRTFHAAAEQEGGLDLTELSSWDLLSAFSRLMRETLSNKQMVITTDDRPLRFYVDRLVHTIQSRRRMSLREIVDEAAQGETVDKKALIGTFCALLELVKIGVCTAQQGSATDEIQVVLRDEVGNDLESIVRLTEFDDEKAADEAALAPDAPNPESPAPSFAASVFDELPEDEVGAHEGEEAPVEGVGELTPVQRVPPPRPAPEAPDYELTHYPQDSAEDASVDPQSTSDAS